MSGRTLVPVGPGIKDAVAATVLKSHEDALRSAFSGGAPWPLLMTTTASLPPPANYQPSLVILSDLPALAYCDGTHWRRADTNGVIV
jgi:hypothetical protein